MENRNNAQFTYQATQISTATKEQLLLITYDIGIKACLMAETALEGGDEQKDMGVANREILRAQEVIRELMVTLNTERGGDMAQSLMRIYDYMYQLLVDANIKKEPDNVRTVRGMLEELKETWEGALVQLLQDYQAAHPEDEDFKAAVSQLGGSAPQPKPQPQQRVAPAMPPKAQPAPRKAESFTLAV